MIKEADATAIKEDIVDATVELKSCSMPRAVPVLVLWMPPAKKQHPSTRRMLERILPSILDCTILISPFLSATILTYKRLAELNAVGIFRPYDQFHSIAKCSI